MSLIRMAGAATGAIALGGLLALGVRLVLPPSAAKRADRLPSAGQDAPAIAARAVKTADVPEPAASAERFQLQRDLDFARAQRTAALTALAATEAERDAALNELVRSRMPPSPFEQFPRVTLPARGGRLPAGESPRASKKTCAARDPWAATVRTAAAAPLK